MLMKAVFSAILIFFSSWAAVAWEDRDLLQKDIDRQTLEQALVMDGSWNPFPAYANRAGWDRLTGERRDEIIACGEKYLTYEWKNVNVMDYIEFRRSGRRDVMERPYGDNNNAIASLMCAELAEGKGRFIPQLINGIFHTCEMTSWALSAHLAQLTADRNPFPEKGDNTLELTQGDVSQMLSWAWYFFHNEFDKIDPLISERLKAEIRQREMDSYLSREDFWWMGLGQDTDKLFLNNWNPWCNSNALLTFMLIEEDRGRMTQAVWKSIRSVDRYLNYIQGDGGIEEGAEYWLNSAGKLYEYLCALQLVTGGKVSIFDESLIRGMGEFIARVYIGDGWTVNFADASPKANVRNAGLIFSYGKAVESRMMQSYAAGMTAGGRQEMKPTPDIFRFLLELTAMKEMALYDDYQELPDYTWYPETQFFLNRCGSLYLAAKGGYNAESHNHNDVGTFCLYANNEPVLIDVGVGTYTRQTFSDERYKIWTMQSGYHNIPKINGIEQPSGKRYKARDVKASNGTFSLDIAGAYPETAKVENWVRTYRLSEAALDISDKFALSDAAAPNEIVFMTWGKLSQDKAGVISIETPEREIQLRYPSDAFEVMIEAVDIADTKIQRAWGERIFRIRLVSTKLHKKGTYRYRIVYNKAN